MKFMYKTVAVGLTMAMATSSVVDASAKPRHHHRNYGDRYQDPGPIVNGSPAGVAMGVLGTGIIGAPGSIPNYGLGLGYFGPGYGYYGPGY